MPERPRRSLRPALPLQPLLRRDAALLALRNGTLHLALSARQVLTVDNASLELVDWLLLLDGTTHLDAALAAAPVPESDARYLLAELDRGGFLAEANEGLLFRHDEAAPTDALRLAQQARAGSCRSTGRPHARGGDLVLWLRGDRDWTQPLQRALALPGLRVQPDGSGTPDLVVVMAAALDPAAESAAAMAMAKGTPHVCIAVSAVDAVMMPLTLPGRTACRRCWALRRDNRVADWPAWTYGGRLPDPPRLPVHHRAMVLGLVVEHLLSVLPVLRDPEDPHLRSTASLERYLDLRRATVEVVALDSHPSCGCIRSAA